MDRCNTYGQTASGQKEPLAEGLTFKSAMKVLIASKDNARYSRLFVTDSDDCINFDWSAEKGMTFPGPNDGQPPAVYSAWKQFFPPRSK